MESLALDIIQGKRPDIANSCPYLKELIADFKQGRVTFREFVVTLKESKAAAEAADVI